MTETLTRSEGVKALIALLIAGSAILAGAGIKWLVTRGILWIALVPFGILLGWINVIGGRNDTRA